MGAIVATAALVPASGAAASTPSSSRSTPRAGYVDVSVATVWTDPSKPREIDAPALTNPVRIQKWLSSMSVAQKRALTSLNATQTQTLYGAKVDILKEERGWYEVAVPGQPTPKNPLGYPGWVPKVQVSTDRRYGRLLTERPFALVNQSAATWLYEGPALRRRFLQVSYDTRLPFLGRSGRAIEVALPGGGSAWLSARSASVFASESAIPKPTGAKLVRDARLFLHRPYIWAGASGFGFDCSGFTHTLYHANGIVIGRDADAQAAFTGHGTKVARSDLRPGDILFYASSPDPSTIYHDAMYVGHGKMAEAYKADTPVRITAVRFGNGYWGAERFRLSR
jgi:cell wall-associated NlpC family hydrolase